MRIVAFAAIDRLIGFGFKRNLRGFTTLCTYRIEHLTMGSALSTVFARASAFPAAGRLIPEALLRIKLLLTRCKGELLTAVLADQHFVFKHSNYPFGYLA